MGAASLGGYPSPTVTTYEPGIGTRSVTFRFPDEDRALRSVKLDQEITRPRPGPDFVRNGKTWELRFARPPVDRLEYKFVVAGPSRDPEVICDPNNPRRAAGPFGAKSVIEWPEYRKPQWTQGHLAMRGNLTRLVIPSRALRAGFGTILWTSPRGEREQPLPLLIVHDGPEYDAYSNLLTFLSWQTEAGRLPPMRAALLPPVDRDHTYSASALYARAFGEDILPALLRSAPTPPGPEMRVGMGASLGALAMLHIHRTKPATFGALFLQSGSYFRQRFDSQEAAFVRFRRITRFVGQVLTQRLWSRPIPVAMTCGTGEENLRNNRVIRDALKEQGYYVRWHEVRDAHNWTAWRDAFQPALTRLLKDAWA
jgi:enterochelin esterase-like enzyme